MGQFCNKIRLTSVNVYSHLKIEILSFFAYFCSVWKAWYWYVKVEVIERNAQEGIAWDICYEKLLLVSK